MAGVVGDPGGHAAFSLVDVIPDVGERVSTLTYHGDFVYVGTASGRVLAYRVHGVAGSGGSGRTEYTSVRVASAEVAAGGGSKRSASASASSSTAVTQIEAVPDTGLLIALCEGALSLFELETLARVPAGLLDGKGVSSFALNVRGAAARQRLCVAISAGARQRRLRLFEWAEGKYCFLKELDLPDSPRALAYVGGRLFLGYAREYNILQDDTGDVQDLFAAAALARDTRPLIKYLPGDKLVIITAEDLGVVVTAAGEPAPVPTPKFGHHPLALAYCYPFLISVCETSSRMEIHSARSATGRLGGGGRDEVVQAIDIPLGAVALVDGRAGYHFRTVLDYSDTARGRNPVYVAFGQPGRVARLQPVPVDSQVEEMLAKLQVAAAEELLVNTAPDATVLARKLARLRIDAGRVLLFSLEFEAAFEQLSLSAMDPREVLALFPGLALSAAGAAAAAAPMPPVGASPLHVLAAAFRHPARYLHPALCASVAGGSRSPRDAVSEAADATGGAAAAAAVVEAEDFLSAGAGGGLEHGVVALGPDIEALISAQLPAYAERARRADAARAELSPHSPPPPRALPTAGERLVACHEALLRFLRGRRAALIRHVRCGAAGEQGRAVGTGIGSGGAGVGDVSRNGGGSGRVPDDLAAELVRASAYDPTCLREDEVDALLLALDTALLKLLHATRRWAQLDRFAFRCPAVDMPDALAFLRAVGKYHTVALLLQGRGMTRDALAAWRELGTGAALEYREGAAVGGDVRAAIRRAGGRRGSDGGSSAGEQPLRRSSIGSDDGQQPPRARADSLSSDEGGETGGSKTEEGGDAAGEHWLPPSLLLFSSRAAADAGAGGAGSDAARYTGVDDSLEILRRESDAALVFEFCEWLLAVAPARALTVFTAGLRPHPFDADDVLAYLRGPRLADLARRQPGAAPARLFLEHLVFARGRKEARYHTQLALEYISGVLALRMDASGGASGGVGSSPAAAALDRDARLTGSRAERPPPGSEGGMLGELRARLFGLLQDSSHYDALRLQAAVESSPLFEERVLLHARRREHARALALLVHSLGDHAHAVRYCAMLSRRLFGEGTGPSAGDAEGGGGGGKSEDASSDGGADGADAPVVEESFPTLLRLYLEADARERERRAVAAGSGAGASVGAAALAAGGGVPTVYLERALDVLTRFGDFVHPLALARLLPGHLPLRSLLPYWSTALPASQHRSREAAVRRHLLRLAHLGTAADLAREEQRHVTVTRHTACAVCDKRLDDAVFAALADGSLLHYGCLRELSNTHGAALGRADAAYGARRLGLLPSAAAVAASIAGAASSASPTGTGGDDAPPPAVRDVATDPFPLYTANLPPAAASFLRAPRVDLALDSGSDSRSGGYSPPPAPHPSVLLAADAASAAALADTEAPVPSTALAQRPVSAFVTTKLLRVGGAAPAAIVSSKPGLAVPMLPAAALPPRQRSGRPFTGSSPAPAVRMGALVVEDSHFAARRGW